MANGFDDDDDAITGINVTPLVDIVLVLLIIFMMTASYIVAPAIRVELPAASTGDAVVESTLSLILTKEGATYLNDRPIAANELRAFIQKERAAGKVEAIIAADGSVPHRQVIALIDLIKSEGVTKFALSTQTDLTKNEGQGT